jgi:hypothetical protein
LPWSRNIESGWVPLVCMSAAGPWPTHHINRGCPGGDGTMTMAGGPFAQTAPESRTINALAAVHVSENVAQVLRGSWANKA